MFSAIANHILRPVYSLNASDAVDLKCLESADLKCKSVCKLSKVNLLGSSLRVQRLPRRKC